MAGPEFKITFKGADALVRRFKELAARLPIAIESALVREAEETITEAKLITPVDEGVLRASGHVQQPKRDGPRVSVEAGFGGPAAPYALFVHEDLTAHHPVGQAKFLEVPVNKRRGSFAGRLAARVDAALGRR